MHLFKPQWDMLHSRTISIDPPCTHTHTLAQCNAFRKYIHVSIRSLSSVPPCIARKNNHIIKSMQMTFVSSLFCSPYSVVWVFVLDLDERARQRKKLKIDVRTKDAEIRIERMSACVRRLSFQQIATINWWINGETQFSPHRHRHQIYRNRLCVWITLICSHRRLFFLFLYARCRFSLEAFVGKYIVVTCIA